MATTVTPTHAESFSRIAEAHQISPPVIDDLLEHIPVGLMIADANGAVVFANAAARALRIDRLEPLQWAITRALLTEDNVREDEIAIAPLGEPRRWVSAHIIPVRAEARCERGVRRPIRRDGAKADGRLDADDRDARESLRESRR